MATSTYGTPYVQGSDLVSAYPTASSNLATRVDEVSYKRNGLNAQTGTTYTLVAGDAGKTITLSNASPVAVTLPQDSTADLPDGAVVTFYNLGAGTVTISQGTGATLQGGSLTLAQYDVTSVIKLSANTYGKFDQSTAAGLIPVTPTSTANTGGTATLSLSTVTFTTVSSVSLNGIFTSTYANYFINLRINAASASSNINMRLRASGTDTSTAYYYGYNYCDYSGATGGYLNGSNVGQWLFTYADIIRTSGFMYLFSPQLAAVTTMHAMGQNAATNGNSRSGAGMLNNTTAYDGLTIFPASGTIDGVITVYGLKG